MTPSSRTSVRSLLRAIVFVALSLALHVAVLLAFVGVVKTPPTFVISLPDEVEFGIAQPQPTPGASGSAPPAAKTPAPVPKAPTPKIEPKRAARAESEAVAVNETANAAAPAAGAAAGEGHGLGGSGSGLGFGSGGFGNGAGEGVIIGLHADLDRIRASSLVLETRALLQLIPEWEKLLKGSGIDPLKHLSRVFVATPNGKRAQLVVSARVRGGARAVEAAAARLAAERGESASFRDEGGLSVAPWYSRGPTAREVALVTTDQFVIARPVDVSRVLGVANALAARQAEQSEMERGEGAAALLAMYKDEAAALSVENARKFVSGDNAHLPLALRISLSPLDEYHAKFRVFGYYESPARAEHALGRIDALRHELLDHPTVEYFGLRSALDEAKLTQHGDTLQLDTIVTLHQLRYLMAFVRKGLAPRDAPEPSAEPP